MKNWEKSIEELRNELPNLEACELMKKIYDIIGKFVEEEDLQDKFEQSMRIEASK